MCYSCFYTWYPRGHAVSYKCPYCGSSRTGLDISAAIGIAFIIFAGIALAYWYIIIPLAILGWFLWKQNK
jgi:hypothetical protein